jgi:hypothetical protein
VVAIGVGVAATLAWQSYGETTKQIIAMRAPQLGWSPEAQRKIVAFMDELGWAKPPAASNRALGPAAQGASQAASLAQTTPARPAPSAQPSQAIGRTISTEFPPLTVSILEGYRPLYGYYTRHGQYVPNANDRLIYGPGYVFVPGGGILDEACNLPSSTC